MSLTAAHEPGPEHRLLALYDEGVREVYAYVASRCGDRAVAEDLTSETFLAAVQAVRRAARPPDVTIAWLIGIARHKLVDHYRRRARDERKLQAVESVTTAADDPWEAVLDVARAHDTLARLGPHHRIALTLRYVDGLAVPEVAELLDRTVHATEALLVRARAAFRKSYGEEGAE